MTHLIFSVIFNEIMNIYNIFYSQNSSLPWSIKSETMIVDYYF